MFASVPITQQLHACTEQAVRALAAPPQQVNTEQSTTHKLTIDKSTQKPRVVILGSGWGAVSLLRQLPKHIRLVNRAALQGVV